MIANKQLISKVKRLKRKYDVYRIGKFAPSFEIQTKFKIREVLKQLDWSDLSSKDKNLMERIESSVY